MKVPLPPYSCGFDHVFSALRERPAIVFETAGGIVPLKTGLW